MRNGDRVNQCGRRNAMQLKVVRFAANALSPVLLWFIPLCATLIATPVIVHALGPVQYGAYSLVAAIAAFAVLPSSYAAVARFTSGRPAASAMPARLLARIALTQVIAVALNIAAVILIDTLFDLQLPVLTVADHAAWIGCVALLLLGTTFTQLCFGALQHANRWSTAAIILMASGVALPLAGLFLARAGAGWLPILAAQGTILLGAATLLLAVYRRIVRKDLQNSDPVNMPEIAAYMARAGIAGMIGALMAIGERLVISAAYGPAQAGYFALAMALAMLIHALMNAANLRLPAQLSKALGSRDTASAEKHYRKAMRLTFAATMLVLLIAGKLGSGFLTLWLGESTGSASAPLLPWLSLGMAGLAIAVPPWILADVLGLQRLNIMLMLGMGVTWLVAALIAMVLVTGPLAIAVTRGATALCLIPYIAAVERAAFGSTSAAWWVITAGKSAVAGTASVAVVLMLQWLGTDGILIPALAAAGTYFFVAYVAGLVSIADLHPDPLSSP